MRLSNDLPSRTARLLFTGCLILAWWGGSTLRITAAEPAAPAASNNFDPAQLADALRKEAKFCAEMDRDLARDTFDPAAVVQQVGNDPEALFAWMRDRTAYVPYRGALRGAIGVLMDRSGNSLDRALLLGRLLQIAGHRARLAHGQLDQKLAETMLRTAWDDPKSGPPIPSDQRQAGGDEIELNTLASRYGLDPADVRSSYQDCKGRIEKQNEDVIGTTNEQSRALAQLVGVPQTDAAAERARLLEDGADHWWVQVLRGSDWVDLDPATRDAKAGQRRTEPTDTVDLPVDGQLPPDPAISRHEIELRVRIERSGGDVQPISEIPLKLSIRPAELGGAPIELQLQPADWPTDLDMTGNADQVASRLKAALLAQQHWIPVVRIGSQTVMQGGFDSQGVVDPHPRLDMAGKSGSSATGAGRATADLFGGGGPPAPATELTAVWLEYEIRSPGHPPRLISRDLFDARGPATRAEHAAQRLNFDEAMRLRRAAQLFRHFDLMAVGFVPSSEFVQHLALENLIDNEPILVKVLKGSANQSLNQSLKDASRLKPLPAAVLSLAAGRRGPGLDGSALAVNRPNLFATSEGFSVDQSGALSAREEIDIVANEAAIRGIAASDAFERRLIQGVRETVLERYAVGHPVESVNTTALFAASATQKIGWRKLTASDDPALSGLSLSPDTLARIKSDLSAGYTVVAPAAPVAVAGHSREAWWRIDPRDGSCVGIGADGAGPDIVEEAIASFFILVDTYLTVKCILHSSGWGIGCIVCAVARLVIDVITGGNGRLVAALIGLNSLGASHICQMGIGE